MRVNPWLLVAGLWFVAALNYVDRQVVFSLFPLLSADLKLSSIELGLLATVFLWVYGTLSPLAGHIADRAGAGRTIMFSLLVWSGVTVLTGLAQNAFHLFSARAAMGISEAFYLPAALAMINAVHGDRTRSLATGLHQSGLYIGLLSGGWLGGLLGQQFGWRVPFFTLGAIGLAYAAVLPWILPSRPPAVVTARRGFFASLPALLAVPGYLPIALVFGLKGIADWMIYTWLSLYVLERFGYGLAEAALTATAYPQGASFAGVLLGGVLADRLSQHRRGARLWVQSAGLFLCGILIAALPLATNRATLIATLIVLGIGKGAYDANAMPTLAMILPKENLATAFGWMNMLSCFAGGASAAAGGWFREHSSLDHAFLLGGGTLLICSVMLAAAARTSPRLAVPA